MPNVPCAPKQRNSSEKSLPLALTVALFTSCFLHLLLLDSSVIGGGRITSRKLQAISCNSLICESLNLWLKKIFIAYFAVPGDLCDTSILQLVGSPSYNSQDIQNS